MGQTKEKESKKERVLAEEIENEKEREREGKKKEMEGESGKVGGTKEGYPEHYLINICLVPRPSPQPTQPSITPTSCVLETARGETRDVARAFAKPIGFVGNT